MRWLIVGLLIGGCATEFGPPADVAVWLQPEPAPRRLLMISIDTLRRDAVTGEQEETPFLHELRGDSRELLAHQSCSSWTFPSVLCALSGKDLPEVGFIPVVGAEVEVVPEEITLLPDYLRALGWVSGIVSANGFLCEAMGIGDNYDDPRCMIQQRAERVVDGGLELLDDLEATGQPWLLHVHFMDPHIPYYAPQEYLDEVEALPSVSVDFGATTGVSELSQLMATSSEEEQELLQAHIDARYAAEVAYLDDEIARLWSELDARGALEDTLVVLWSDHGEQLFEHDYLGHGKTLFGVESDATALFWAPGLEPGGYHSRSSHVDLLPTILQALGMPQPEGMGGVAVGLRPDQATFGHLPRLTGGHSQSVTRDPYRLIYNWDTGRRQLYHRVDDPEEQHNLVLSEPERVEEMWRHLLPKVEAMELALGEEAVRPP